MNEQELIVKINEIQNWDESKKTNTHSAYIKYISDFPVSDYVDSAKNILKQIEQKTVPNFFFTLVLSKINLL